MNINIAVSNNAIRRWLAGCALLALSAVNLRAADDHDHGTDEHGHAHAEEEHSDEVVLTPDAIQRHGITTGTVRLGALPRTFSAPAQLAFDAEAMAHVGTPIEGRVMEIHARLGDLVAQDAVLLTIESPALGEAQSEFLQKLAAAGAAQTRLEVSKTIYERSQTLLEGKGLALGEFQRREGEFRIAEGELRAARAEVQAAENKLRLFSMTDARIAALRDTGRIDAGYALRAPLPGHIVEREVTLGEIVGPQRDRLLVIADTERLWVLADVPEARLGAIALGAPASVTVESLGARVFPGEITAIAPQLNPALRTAQVRVEIDRGDAALRPGMYGKAEFSTPDPTTTGTQILIPELAVQTVEGGPTVFVPHAEEANTFTARHIDVGPAAGGLISVTEGLKAGEIVVLQGSFILKAEHGKSGAAHEH